MTNYNCPFCKNKVMEPMFFISEPYFFHGLFKCPRCRHEIKVLEIDEELQYDYPFEGVKNEIFKEE